MVDSYHQKTFIILKLNVMSKSNVKSLQYKQNIQKRNYEYFIEQRIFKKMATFDEGLLSEEDLDNIGNDNVRDNYVDESSFDNFTVFEYNICQKLSSPCHHKMPLFALYSNHCMTTAKIKIR